ncbi:phage holin, lambda family [Marinagarivorans algicola]|uniref:phage holin, lambda family n=1 Tax=Marinagarivorans algicola TaxID=1513270 RepID=UPI0006B54641|nr:phage holin, lambda family [Marinagarivorans algicola]
MFEQMPAVLKAVLLAVVVAFIRVRNDGEPRLIRHVVEAAFCGAITVAIFYLVKAMGLDSYQDYAVFLGGFVGMLGSDFVRGVARKLANSKIK